jgi:hypothetical protein
MSRTFSSIFKDIVKDGSANLKLVKYKKEAVSQQTDQSQFPEMNQSQHLSVGDSLYKGIKVQVSFAGDQLAAAKGSEPEKEVISSQEDEQNRVARDAE